LIYLLIMNDLSQKIENLRKNKGILQMDFALKIGINVNTYRNLLKSEDFRLSQLKNMSKILNVPITYFLNDNMKENLPYNTLNIAEKKRLFQAEKELKEIKEKVDLLKQLNQHQKGKINNLYSTIKYLVYEILLHSDELKSINSYNNLFYFLKLYKDDLDSETIKRIEKLTAKHELKLGKDYTEHPKL